MISALNLVFLIIFNRIIDAANFLCDIVCFRFSSALLLLDLLNTSQARKPRDHELT